jgi:UDP-N-acetylmuramate--alanine ligase
MPSNAFAGKLVHIIGIGGIGMSALAKFLVANRIKVQGSDIKRGHMIKSLEDLGIKVFIGHMPDNVGMADIIIRSTAIKDSHVEIIAAKKDGLPILHRSEALAMMLQGYRTIAVTGTHGKSTTTSIIGEVCMGLNPTIINGAILERFDSNVVIGDSTLAIIESDESDESFLVLPADIACVTNMDIDHLDYYGTKENMYASYNKFLQKIPDGGMGFLCLDHPKIAEIAPLTDKLRWLTYGINVSSDITASNIKMQEHGVVFDITFSSNFLSKISSPVKSLQGLELGLYGHHNVQNALPAIGIALFLGVTLDKIKLYLKELKGVQRRFTELGQINGATIIDDYAHHPAEIEATLSVAKALATARGGKVIAVCQPHRYTRLATMMTEFAKSFTDADFIILANVYSAGEKPIDGVDSQTLANKIVKNGKDVLKLCKNYKDLTLIVTQTAGKNDIVVTLGAGDINEWAKQLVGENIYT